MTIRGRPVRLRGRDDRGRPHGHRHDWGRAEGAARGWTLELAPIWRTKFPVDEIFDPVVDSSAVGLRKPDAAIFELTLRRLAVEPEQAVLLDDMDVNLAGARVLGMHAIKVGADEQPALAELDRLLAG